jgi:hypothetical protein
LISFGQFDDARIDAALAVFLAIFVEHKFAAGERGMVLVIV